MLTTKIPQFLEYSIGVSLFDKVSNVQEIRSKIAELPYALIDSTTIYSLDQLFSAIYRVLVEVSYNRLRTKSLAAECLLCLSPTSNIGDAFKKFGIKEDSSSILVVQLTKVSENSILMDPNEYIKGSELEVTDNILSQNCNIKNIRKIYKLDPNFQPESTGKLSDALVSAIQLRGL